jgi:hypothetical protein
MQGRTGRSRAAAVAHMLATASLDLLLWLVLVLFVLRLLRTGDGWTRPPGWRWTTKWLLPLLVLALGVAVVITGPREVLRTWWLAARVGVTVVISAPILVWQATHGWPLLTVAGGISQDDGVENRVLFVPMQLVYLSPVLVPVWFAGIVRLWRDPGACAGLARSRWRIRSCASCCWRRVASRTTRWRCWWC